MEIYLQFFKLRNEISETKINYVTIKNKEQEKLEIYIMLVGLPASGKSSWANNYILKNTTMDFQVVSSDDIIEGKGFIKGLNYMELHKKHIEFSIGEIERRLRKHIKSDLNIIHDQTNLTVVTRKNI
jgi:predicted kinase